MSEPRVPLISITLCTYNGGNYLREQLDSLLAQTCKWHELIVVDDRSTDDTMNILREYANKDSRITIYQNVTNLGPNKNFFKAMSLSSGDLIAPCDQDDVWLPPKLDTLLSAMGNNALVYCDSALTFSTGKLIGVKMSDLLSMISTTDPSCFAFRNCVSGHALLMQRDVFRVAQSVPEGFDYDWWLAAVAASVGGVVYVDVPLVLHRQHSCNTTNTFFIQHPSHNRRKTRGYRLNAVRNAGLRIEALSQIHGTHRLFLSSLYRLWRARESQWFSARLALIMFLHGARLHAPRRNTSIFFLVSLAQRLLWGVRIKRLTNRYAYRL